MRAARTAAVSLPLIQNASLPKTALFLTEFLRETLNRRVLRLTAPPRPRGTASMEIYLFFYSLLTWVTEEQEGFCRALAMALNAAQAS